MIFHNQCVLSLEKNKLYFGHLILMLLKKPQQCISYKHTYLHTYICIRKKSLLIVSPLECKVSISRKRNLPKIWVTKDPCQCWSCYNNASDRKWMFSYYDYSAVMCTRSPVGNEWNRQYVETYYSILKGHLLYVW